MSTSSTFPIPLTISITPFKLYQLYLSSYFFIVVIDVQTSPNNASGFHSLWLVGALKCPLPTLISFFHHLPYPSVFSSSSTLSTATTPEPYWVSLPVYERMLQSERIIFYDEKGLPNGLAAQLASTFQEEGFPAQYLHQGIEHFAQLYPGLLENSQLPLPLKIQELREKQSQMIQAVWYPNQSSYRDLPTMIVPDFLYLGSLSSAHPDILTSMHIHRVIRFGLFDSNVNSLFSYPESIQVHTFVLDDQPQVDLFPYMAPTLALLDHYYEQKEKVLIHCHAGVSRSVSFVLMYLMTRCHCTLLEAFELVFKERPIIRPNPGFARQLLSLERLLFNTSNPSIYLTWMSLDYVFYRTYLEFLIRLEEMGILALPLPSSTFSSIPLLLSSSSTKSFFLEDRNLLLERSSSVSLD